MADIIATALALQAKKQAKLANELLSNFPSGLVYKGSVNYYDLLPDTGNIGDTYTVKYKGDSQDEGVEYIGKEYGWDGTEWILISPIVEHETWTFTLMNGATITKEVASWNLLT